MKFKPDFIIIPFQLFEDKNLQPLDRLLYGVIYYFEKMKEGKCIASNERLAEYCLTNSKKSVQNSLNNLERCCYINRIFLDEQKKNRLEIKCVITFNNVSPNSDTRTTKRLHDVPPNGDHISKSKISKSNNIAFDVFWNLYDKKVGRPKTEKQWNKLKDKEREAIIEYIPKYKEAQPDKKYRKNPQTFFNNRGWEDELVYKGEALPSDKQIRKNAKIERTKINQLLKQEEPRTPEEQARMNKSISDVRNNLVNKFNIKK